jgi:hypothetical protein
MTFKPFIATTLALTVAGVVGCTSKSTLDASGPATNPAGTEPANSYSLQAVPDPENDLADPATFDQMLAQLPARVAAADVDKILTKIDPSAIKDALPTYSLARRGGGGGGHRGGGGGGHHRGGGHGGRGGHGWGGGRYNRGYYGGYGSAFYYGNPFYYYGYGNYYYPYYNYGSYYYPYYGYGGYSPFLYRYGLGSSYFYNPYTYAYTGVLPYSTITREVTVNDPQSTAVMPTPVPTN